MEVYNKNRDNNHSMHDEIREQNAKLKNAPLKEKLAYFKEYYLKTTIIAVVAIILVGSMIYSMLTSPSDTAFAAYFYNNTGDLSDNGLIDGFVTYAGIDTKKSNAYIDTTMHYSPDGQNLDAYAMLEKSMAVITTGELDVVVGDTDTIDYFSNSECLHDITTILPEDLLDAFQDKLYYAKLGESDELTPVGIYVADAPKLNEYHYYTDMEPVFGFVANSNSLDNAVAFLRYLYLD